MVEWLETLYKELLSMCRENRAWCGKVFPRENPDVIMTSILTGSDVIITSIFTGSHVIMTSILTGT